jgi:hypothetical protein
MSDTSIAAGRPRSQVEGQEPNPLRDVLERMDRAREHITKADPQLSDTIKALAERADRPGIMDNPSYRGRVAYALLDLEKLAGPVSNMPERLREEMTRLATSVAGLQNERLQELMRRTAEISDSGLVRDIRVVATDAAQRSVQDTAAIRDRVEVLENRARLSSGRAESSASGASPSERVPEFPASQTRGMPASATKSTPSTIAEMPNEQLPPQRPGNGTGPSQERGLARTAVQVRAPSLIGSIISAMRQADHQGSVHAALDPTPTPMRDRVSRFEQKLQEGRDENTLRGAEQSGRAAIEALQAFANGPGASIMNRIRDAAKADPGGMAGVMSEMRTGGVYADLRAQFDGAMQSEKGFAAAYDRAAAAAGQYARDRMAVDAVVAQRPTVEGLTGRFQKLDAQIGEAAGSTPSRSGGKSALEDLAEKAAELVSRAVDKVKSAISASPKASSSPSPNP